MLDAKLVADDDRMMIELIAVASAGISTQTTCWCTKRASSCSSRSATSGWPRYGRVHCLQDTNALLRRSGCRPLTALFPRCGRPPFAAAGHEMMMMMMMMMIHGRSVHPTNTFTHACSAPQPVLLVSTSYRTTGSPPAGPPQPVLLVPRSHSAADSVLRASPRRAYCFYCFTLSIASHYHPCNSD